MVLNVVVALGIIGLLVWVYQALAAQGQMQPHLWWNAINVNAWPTICCPAYSSLCKPLLLPW